MTIHCLILPRAVWNLCRVVVLLGAGVAALVRTTEAADDPAPLLKTFVEEFVEISPGQGQFPATFERGDAAISNAVPVASVSFQSKFSIAKYEVPQNLYEAVMGRNPSRWQGPRNSVEMLTLAEARDFCSRITRMLRERQLLDENEVVRLPSEAEWEYCCRAGTKTAYSFGDAAQKPGDAGAQASELDPFGWHTGNAAGNDPPVGALKPNPWGLYDMHGYLREMCDDTWHDTYDKVPADGRAAAGGDPEACPVRGGSWKDKYPELRSASRQKFAMTGKDDAVGFRCVRSLAVE